MKAFLDLQQLGLVLDIIGVVLLFIDQYYGFNSKIVKLFTDAAIDASKDVDLNSEDDEKLDPKEVNKVYKRYDLLSLLGFFLILIGFVFQFINSII